MKKVWVIQGLTYPDAYKNAEWVPIRRSTSRDKAVELEKSIGAKPIAYGGPYQKLQLHLEFDDSAE